MKTVLYISFCLWVLQSLSQSSSVATYLQTAAEDQRLERFQAELNFLESNSMRPSLIRETEIRIGTEGLNTTMEEYRLRISPTNPWEIKANNKYHQQLLENTQTRYRISFSKALKSRYELLIEHYHLTKMIQLSQSEISIRKELADKTIQLTEPDLEDLISIESGLSTEELKLAELKAEKSEVSELIALDLNSTINWADFDIILPEKIIEYLNRMDSLEEWNLYKLKAEQELVLDEKMYQVNKTEAFSNIGFLQANYETDQGDSFQEHMGIQVGITLPLANRDKADLARDRFELIEAKKDKEFTNQMIDQQIQLLTSKLITFSEMYALIDEKLNRIENLKPELTEEIDIQAFVKFTTYRIGLLKKQQELHKDILEHFIELMDIQGYLVKSPLINYLSNDLLQMEE